MIEGLWKEYKFDICKYSQNIDWEEAGGIYMFIAEVENERMVLHIDETDSFAKSIPNDKMLGKAIKHNLTHIYVLHEEDANERLRIKNELSRKFNFLLLNEKRKSLP